MGLVPLLCGREVISIKADRATIGTPSGGALTYYRQRRIRMRSPHKSCCGDRWRREEPSPSRSSWRYLDAVAVASCR
jgi:hypothetical protein